MPGQIASSRAARDLRQQLKHSLRRAKVRQAQREVRAHYAHQRDAMNVVALGDHLRADQQVDLAGVQPREQPLHIAAAADRVAIHAPDARVRKELLQPLLALLRSAPEKIKMLALALRTDLRHTAPKAAVVALQPLPQAARCASFRCTGL